MSSSAIGCSFWSTKLSFTNPVTARHYCLIGHNRYAAPITYGSCNDHDPTTGSVCQECLSWDGTYKRDCFFRKGYGAEMGIAPPVAGYDDANCPIGYEEYIGETYLELSCPTDSVLVLEILPSVPALALGSANSTFATIHRANYDFAITTPRGVVREFEAHQCLTGTGGRKCGEDALTMLAYQPEGKCQVAFSSGLGYRVQCDNGLQESSSFFAGDKERATCFTKNAYTCLEVMQQGSSSKNEVVVLNGNGGDFDNNFPNGLCGMDEAQNLNNPLAWLVAVGTVLLTLLPVFSCWTEGQITPAFLVGLLVEAMKNGLVMVSVFSVDWSCLQQYGLILPTGNQAIFLPYGLIAFSLADTILALIALFSRWGHKLEATFDKFKWLDRKKTVIRRIMTFATIVIFGGLGGFMQLALVLEGTVDSPYPNGGESLSVWASWTFIISASLGALFGTVLVLYGVYTGKMRVAWKTYKILVGDIPGLVCAVDLAVVLSVGWLAEAFADLVHIILYLPPLWEARKKVSLDKEVEAALESEFSAEAALEAEMEAAILEAELQAAALASLEDPAPPTRI